MLFVQSKFELYSVIVLLKLLDYACVLFIFASTQKVWYIEAYYSMGGVHEMMY